MHPEIERAVAAAVKTFAGLGAKVEEAEPDLGGDPIATWNTFWWPAMAIQLQAFGDRVHDAFRSRAACRRRAEPRRVRVFDHVRAQLARAKLHNIMVRFHETYDLLLTPALPLPAFEVGDLVPRSGDWGKAWCDWAPFSYPFNLTTQPAASVPCGLTQAGLPIGLQIVGPVGADALVLRAARAFEAAAPSPRSMRRERSSRPVIPELPHIRDPGPDGRRTTGALEHRACPCEHASKGSADRREETLAEEIRIEFTRFSAFYSPLIATMAGGFLKAEGLEGKHSVSAPGKSAIAGLLDGSVHVAQSAPSQGFTPLEQGKQPPALHFAQINEKDGFFLTGRSPDPAFSWDKLKGKKVIVDHGGQPMAMFKYACFKRGLDFKAIEAVDAGSTDKMIAAFRAGQGDFIHLQGPAPQQLEHDKAGHIVANLGDAIGPCAFSSLAATRDWLKTDRPGPSCAPIARRAPG